MKGVCAAALLAAAAGCDGGNTPPDGGPDPDAKPPPDAGVPAIAAPAAPVLTPCPAGFSMSGEPARCEPFPEGGRHACEAFEAHFPGEADCVSVGSACPAGRWPDDLPATDVRYVSPDAEVGGDGTRASPLASIAAAIDGAAPGTVVALAKGTYEEAVQLPAGVTLWGACPAETAIHVETASPVRDGVVTVAGVDARLVDLSISGSREGLVLGEGARASLEGVVVLHATGAGITVHPDATLTGEHVSVRDTAVVDGVFGLGIAVAARGGVDLRRLAVSGATSAAVATFGGAVSLADSVLADSRAQPRDGLLGVALDAFGGARVNIERSVMEGHTNRALMVYEPRTVVQLEDSVVRDTSGRHSDGREGRGAFVFDGATLSLSRSWLRGHREVAVIATDAESRVELEDVIVEDTEDAEADGRGGSALALQEGATASIARAWLEDNRAAAVAVFGDSILVAQDVTIHRTENESVDGRFGVGLLAQSGATVEGARVAIVESRQAGISAAGDGTRITLEDALIETTRERACATDTCAGLGIGDGVISTLEAHVILDRFEVRDSARAGVHVAAGAMDLREGRVADNPIGAVVQTPGFDVARLSEGVVYENNGRNLDMSALPLPEPAPGF